MNIAVSVLHVLLISFSINSMKLEAQASNEWMRAHEFVFLDSLLAHAHYDVRYAGTNNFVGKVVKGYESNRLVMTKSAAEALKKAEGYFYELGYGLKIFDTYRPTRAVEHFNRWSRDPSDTLAKEDFLSPAGKIEFI